MHFFGKWWNRFQVLLVMQLRSASFLLSAALMLIVYLFLTSVSLPTASNRDLGIMSSKGPVSDEVVASILADEGTYHWIEYKDSTEMIEAVKTGAVDSAFYLTEKLDAAVEAVEADRTTGGGRILMPELKDSVVYYTSPSSTKGAAAKESVYVNILEAVTPSVLRSAVRSGTVFEDTGEEAEARITRELDKVLADDYLLHVNFEVYGGSPLDAVPGEAAERHDTGASPVVASTLLFLSALLFAAVKFRSDSASLAAWFRLEGPVFRTAEVFAPVFLSGAVLLIVMCAKGWISLLAGLIYFPLLLLASVWSSLFVRLFRREGVYLFLSVTLTAVSALLNSSGGTLFFFKSVRWARYLLPASWLCEVLKL